MIKTSTYVQVVERLFYDGFDKDTRKTYNSLLVILLLTYSAFKVTKIANYYLFCKAKNIE